MPLTKTIYTILLGLCFIPLSAQLTSPTAVARIVYDETSRELSLQGLRPPNAAAGANNTARWSYFWEFGDGHFSTAERPRYCFGTIGPQTVRLSLVPHYSHDRTETITQTISVFTNCDTAAGESEEYGLGDDLVRITTNAHNELVPQNEIQIVVHYALPSTARSSEGDLFLFYNERELEDQLGFPPLASDLSDPNRFRLHGAELLLNPREAIETGGVNYRLVRSLYADREYKVQAFRCRLAPGENRRLFLTLRASESLQLARLDGKKAELTTQLKAVWVPRGQAFAEGRMVADYPLKILSVHDPNRLRIHSPRGKATYAGRNRETFDVEVQFQNYGGRAARRVQVEVPWPANLDATTLKIEGRNPDAEICPDCPAGPPVGSTASCFQLDTARLAATGNVSLIFHNVMVHGKREDGVGGARYTKGTVRFSAQNGKKRGQNTSLAANIYFDGEAAVKTRARSRRWQHKGVGLKLGYNYAFAPDGYDRTGGTDFGQVYNIGLYYRRAALVSGFTPLAGAEVAMSAQAFSARTCSTDSNEPFNYSTLFLSRETVNVQSLDLQVMSELRFGGVAAFVVGLGPSIPLFADGTFTTNALTDQGIVDRFDRRADFWYYGCDFIQDNTDTFEWLLDANNPEIRTTSFGLLDGERGTQIFDEDVNSNFGLGAIGSVAAEFGSLNSVALGIRQNFRIYPNSYREACLKFTNAEAYLRINLTSLR